MLFSSNNSTGHPVITVQRLGAQFIISSNHNCPFASSVFRACFLARTLDSQPLFATHSRQSISCVFSGPLFTSLTCIPRISNFHRLDHQQKALLVASSIPYQIPRPAIRLGKRQGRPCSRRSAHSSSATHFLASSVSIRFRTCETVHSAYRSYPQGNGALHLSHKASPGGAARAPRVHDAQKLGDGKCVMKGEVCSDVQPPHVPVMI